MLLRVGRGAYALPMLSYFGYRPPSTEVVVEAIESFGGEIIVAGGATKTIALGLTTQTMTRKAFIMGPTRKLRLGSRTVGLKHSSRWQPAPSSDPRPVLARASAGTSRTESPQCQIAGGGVGSPACDEACAAQLDGSRHQRSERPWLSPRKVNYTVLICINTATKRDGGSDMQEPTMNDIMHPGTRAENPGFPNAPDGWTADVARSVASKENLALTEDHWRVVRALQEYFVRNDDDRVNVRELHDALGEMFHAKGGLKYLYDVLPGGPVAQGCRLAGLEVPTGAVDANFGSVM